MTTRKVKLKNCSGCTDDRSEGTHQMHTIQHPCPEGGDPNCGYCIPTPTVDCCEKCRNFVCMLKKVLLGEATSGNVCSNPSCPCHSRPDKKYAEFNPSDLEHNSSIPIEPVEIVKGGELTWKADRPDVEDWEKDLEKMFSGFFCNQCYEDTEHETAKCTSHNLTNFYWMQGQLKQFIRSLLLSRDVEVIKKLKNLKSNRDGYYDAIKAAICIITTRKGK